MRTSTYAGLVCGARVIEQRKGTVSWVEIGSVRWPDGEEAAITKTIYTFRPNARLVGNVGKAVAAELSAARMSTYDKFSNTFGDNRPSYDAIIQRNGRTQSNPAGQR
jgi:hypothetical protein